MSTFRLNDDGTLSLIEGSDAPKPKRKTAASSASPDLQVPGGDEPASTKKKKDA